MTVAYLFSLTSLTVYHIANVFINNLMSTQNHNLKTTFYWTLPTSLELVGWFYVSLVTVWTSNLGQIRSVLYIPDDFNLFQALLNSVENLLSKVIGQATAGKLVLVVFWALIGMAVYMLVWASQNLTTEFGNSVALTKYAKPRGSDHKAALKYFVSGLVFRLFAGIILLLYINVVVTILVPYWSDVYRSMIQSWPDPKLITQASLAIVTQTICLHFITILTRLVLLKRRVF